MSFKLMSEAMEVETGNPITKLILLKLCDNSNDDGECWPSYTKMADQCEVHRDTAIKHIKKLIDMGIVTKTKRESNNGRTTSNMYIISFIGVVQNDPGGSTERLGGVVENDPHYIEPIILNLSSEPKSNKKDFTCSDDDELNKINLDKKIELFENFWSTYPSRHGRKVGKAITKNKFLKLTYSQQQQCIINVNNYRVHCETTDTFPKDPVRFFKDNMWQEWSETIEDPTQKRDHNGFSADSKSIIIPGFEDFGEFQIDGGNE